MAMKLQLSLNSPGVFTLRHGGTLDTFGPSPSTTPQTPSRVPLEGTTVFRLPSNGGHAPV